METKINPGAIIDGSIESIKLKDPENIILDASGKKLSTKLSEIDEAIPTIKVIEATSDDGFDSVMSDTSENVVKNKTIKAYIDTKIAEVLALAKAYTDLKTTPLPVGYTALSYVENPNGAYIDLGLTLANANIKIESVLQAESTSAEQDIFSNFNTGGFSLHTYANSNNVRWYYAGGTAVSGVIDGAKHTFICLNASDAAYYGESGRALYVDGVRKIAETASTQLSGNSSVKLFAKGNGTTFFFGKMYSFKIWEAGVLKRNMIPCANESGAIGMYDLVNETFYGSANNNALTGA